MATVHVYLMRCRDGSLYCGWSTNAHARESTHNAGKGAAYTRSRRPVRLVYLETLPNRSAALRRECAIKRLTRLEKLQLVAMSPPLPRPRRQRLRTHPLEAPVSAASAAAISRRQSRHAAILAKSTTKAPTTPPGRRRQALAAAADSNLR